MTPTPPPGGAGGAGDPEAAEDPRAPVSGPSLGAYVLPGDPTWLASSLSRYYDHLDDLVVAVPSDGRSWTGRPLPVAECLAAVAAVDRRGIARRVEGRWCDPGDPMSMETAQRQRAIDALTDAGVDWLLQLDGDEVLPDAGALLAAVADADARGLDAVEWPMRTLFRHRGGERYLEVVGRGGPVYDYPAPIAVRRGVRLDHARRVERPRLRVAVTGDDRSLPVVRTPEPGVVVEHRTGHDGAVLHNSWARSPATVRRKLRSYGHRLPWGGWRFYLLSWWPSRWAWRLTRDVHPFSGGAWPLLAPATLEPDLLLPRDQPVRHGH